MKDKYSVGLRERESESSCLNSQTMINQISLDLKVLHASNIRI